MDGEQGGGKKGGREREEKGRGGEEKGRGGERRIEVGDYLGVTI